MKITTNYSLELTGEELTLIVRCLEDRRRSMYANLKGMERDIHVKPYDDMVAFLRPKTDSLGLHRVTDWESVEFHRTMPYAEYLLSEHWKFVRALALERDDNKCRLCGIREGLQVHHSSYDNRGNEDQYLNDLITLCGNCHATFHGKIPA